MLTVAEPIFDSAGQPAGLASNCAVVHAFCSVVSREGSAFGSSTLTFAMSACVPCDAAG